MKNQIIKPAWRESKIRGKRKNKGKEAVQADRNCTSQAARQGRTGRKCREGLGGKAGKGGEEMTGKGAAEQNLAHPSVRSKPIVPLEVAEVG